MEDRSAEDSVLSQCKIAVIGAGYVGIATVAVLVTVGYEVICAEIDRERLRLLRSGVSPIAEPGVEDVIATGMTNGRLTFVDSGAVAVREADVVFLCVPTPKGSEGAADLSYIETAVDNIISNLKSGSIVVIKSTVPVGTARYVQSIIGRSDVAVVSNPEFLREGRALADGLAPDRVIIGARHIEDARRIAKIFGFAEAPIVLTDLETAETIKYAANAFLATKLSFINAIAGLSEAVGANIDDVVQALGYDQRIGPMFLSPGPGWGGSCLPKDTEALLSIARKANFDFPLLETVIDTNREQMNHIVDKVEAAVGDLAGKTIALWGLTFKAFTGDLRDSPAITIARGLEARGAILRAYDPTVEAHSSDSDLVGIETCVDASQACLGAHALVVLTEWPEFREVDFVSIRDLLLQRNIIDARNLLDAEKIRSYGFTYVGVGRH